MTSRAPRRRAAFRNRRPAGDASTSLGVSPRGSASPGHRNLLFAGHTEGHPAGRKDSQVRYLVEPALEPTPEAGQLLDVVEHEERRPRTQKGDDRGLGVLRLGNHERELRRDGSRHVGLTVDRPEIDEPPGVTVRTGKDRAGECRLADAARPRQGDEPAPGEERDHPVPFPVATDDRRVIVGNR